MYAVIDIGSNTIRLCVYKVTDVGFSLVAKKRSVAGLASYVDKKGNLRDDGIKKLIAVLESFKAVYEPLKVTRVLPFATASLRLVKNREQIVKRIRKETGLDVILKVAPHRIHTLIPGMIILKTIAKYFKSKKLIISKYGIREGYFLSQLNK
ncbi:MAG: hypothetical protein MJY87_03570 [Fibrobacter sp.]|nr:hypothetical protein [Fibrobacter sp.]